LKESLKVEKPAKKTRVVSNERGRQVNETRSKHVKAEESGAKRRR
jgi:hypothetical protein